MFGDTSQSLFTTIQFHLTSFNKEAKHNNIERWRMEMLNPFGHGLQIKVNMEKGLLNLPDL